MKVVINKKIIGWRVKEEVESVREKIKDSNSPKRPTELKCDIHRAKIAGEDWTILIGLMEGRPYEVMGGLSSNIEIPKTYKDGILIKHGNKKSLNARYDLKFGSNSEGNSEGILIKDVVSIFDNPNNGSLTRMVSMCLRHGIPIQYISEQLNKDKYSDMFSFSAVVSRVLKKYIVDGAGGGGKCDECKSSNLMYTGGCPVCQDCGYSKCG